MMELREIHKIELSGYNEENSSGKRSILHREDQIKGLLSQIDQENPDLNIKELLCKANISDDQKRSGKKIITYSHAGLGHSPKRMIDLSNDKRESAEENLNKIKNLLNEKILSLRNEGGENVKKAEWLEKINNNISHKFTFVGENDQIALVAWGLEEKEISGEKVIVIDEREPEDEAEPGNKVGGEDEEKPGGQKGHEEPGPKTEGPEKPDDTPDPPESWWRRALKLIKSWWSKALKRIKYWWWRILVLVLLFILLLLLFRGCEGCNSGREYLPPETGVIVPIESKELIVFDEDSLTQIVADRLNIILRGNNKNIAQFAREFKRHYSGNEYEVIYYDDRIYRLQIRVPQEKRSQVKRELPGKMPDFDMLIWHESLFHSNQANDRENSKASWHHKIVGSENAWEITTGAPNVVIAILDDGFDLDHEALRGAVVNPYNVITRNANVVPNPGNYHGNHVAGLAIGNKLETPHFSGLCPSCSFMPVKISDKNGLISSSAIIDGILYATYNGADVINLSIEQVLHPLITELPIGIQMDIIQNNYRDEAEFWQEMFKIAEDHGSTIVTSGGNLDVLIGIDPMKRTNQIISVSAVDHNFKRAGFSNFGSFSTVSAPGIDVLSSSLDGGYTFESGTSMASPIVAGGIGLIKSIDPTLTTEEISELLRRTGKRIDNGSKNIGPIIQLDAALRSLSGIPEQETEDQPSEENAESPPNCALIEMEIMRLQREIDRLKGQCPSFSTPPDTLVIPEDSKDLSFMTGRWKSTTPLHNMETGEPVVLYFTFRPDAKGNLNLYEMDETVCTASLHLELNHGELDIYQNEVAICSPGDGAYSRYEINCINNRDGHANCIAQNIDRAFNRVEFHLIKID